MVLAFVGALVLVGLFGAVLLTAVGFVLRAALWLLLLPFKLVFLAIGVPVAIVGFVLLTVAGLVGGTLLLSAGILAGVLFSALLPLVLVVFAVWAIVRLAGRAATA
jgi:hypothetical protein